MSISSLRPSGSVFARLGAQSHVLRALIAWLSGRAPVIGFAFAGAFVLGALAGPRFAAQAVLLPYDEILEALQIGAPLSPLALSETANALRLAHRLDSADGRIATDLALVELDEADGPTPKRAALLDAAIGDLEAGLSHAPANSFAWARLAGARLAREGAGSPKMLAALRMSYVTGLYADKIMPFRAALSLGQWDGLDAQLRDLAKRELVYLWERRGAFAENQLPLMRTLCRTGRVGVLTQALIEGHRSLGEFDKLYPIYLSPDACRAKFPQ
jgi:hypothetical protein